MRKPVAAIALLALLLSGCAGKMDAQRGLSEEWRLRSLEENFLNFKENQRETEERGRDSQRKLLERVRALEESVARMQEQSASLPQKRVEPLASAPVLVPKYPAPAPAQAPAAPKPKPEVAQALAEAAAAEPAAPQPMSPKAPAPAAVPATGKSLYDQGMTLVRAEKSEEGRKLLSEFLETDPGSALVPNAIYWIGESRFIDKDYAQAILTFKDVTRRFPKHHKAAAALLKIAMCYQQLGEKDNATLYLRALLRDHPKSEPAPAARKMLAELGG